MAKRVWKTTLLFFAVVGLVSLLLAEFYLQTEYRYFQDAKERNELAGSLDTLYCGASFALRAFRPDLLDPELGTQSYNLSGSRLTMHGKYTLLQKELARNPVKTVVLECSFDMLTRNPALEGPEGDLLVYARLRGKDRWAYFFEAFRPADYPLFYYEMVANGAEGLGKLASGVVRYGNWQLKRGYFPYSEPDEPFSLDYAARYHTRDLPTWRPPENLEYLDRIIRLCREHGAEPVLVSVPQSMAFNCTFTNLDGAHDWYAAYAAQNGLRYYDFNLYRGIGTLLPDDTCFFDEFHLNNRGAEIFNGLYADVMRRVAAGEDVSASFCRSYTEALAAAGIPGA